MVSKREQDRAFDRARHMESDIDQDMASTAEEASALKDQIDPDQTQSEPTEEDLVDAVRMGAATETVEIMGHEVTFSVLNTRRELQAGQLTRSVADSVRPMAIRTAYFALSVQTIDSIPFYTPIAADGSEHIARYQKALDYYSPFIDAFWEEYVDLRNETIEKMDALGK